MKKVVCRLLNGIFCKLKASGYFSSALSILSTLNHAGYEAYIVGGAVRDALLEKPVSDIDICTDCPQEELQKYFTVFEIGKSKQFGLVAVKCGAFTYEVSNYRSDAKTFYEDCQHRDFTINAIAIDAECHLIDPLNGIKDLKEKKLVFAGDPAQRIYEDPLRMVRACRFAVKYNLAVDVKSLLAIRRKAFLIKGVSVERIFGELEKMANAAGADFAHATGMLETLNLLKFILPEVQELNDFYHTPAWHPEGAVFKRKANGEIADFREILDTGEELSGVDVYEGSVFDHVMSALAVQKREDALLNFCILFHDLGKPRSFRLRNGKTTYYSHAEIGESICNSICDRLKFPSQYKDAIAFCTRNHMKFCDFVQMKNHKCAELILNRNFNILKELSLSDDFCRYGKINDEHWSAIEAKIEKLKSFMEKSSAFRIISGKYIIELLGIRPGPEVGRIMKKARAYALDKNIINESEIADYIRALYCSLKSEGNFKKPGLVSDSNRGEDHAIM